MDFVGLKLYDTWVNRDMQGQLLSAWYPYVAEPIALAN